MKNPLLLVGLAVGGLLLFSRAQAQRRAVTGASSRTTADYFNPVDLAAAFGRAVVATTRGVATSAPAGIFAVTGPIVPGTAASGLLGWENYDPGGIGDPYGSWVSPIASRVNDSSVSRYSPTTDAIVASPFYDIATDFQNNPTPYTWTG